MNKRIFITLGLLIGAVNWGTGLVRASQLPAPPVTKFDAVQERQWWRYGMQAALKLPTPEPMTPTTKVAYQAGFKAMCTWQAEQPAPINGWVQWLATLSDQHLATLMAKATVVPALNEQPDQGSLSASDASPQLKNAEERKLKDSVPINQPSPVVPMADYPNATINDVPALPVIEHPVTSATAPTMPLKASDQLPKLTAPLTKVQQRFIKRLQGPAQQIGRRYDLYPSVLLAQAVLESNWGTSDLATSYHNYFGIKGTYHGQGVQLPTLEHYQGHDMAIMDQFKHYPDLTSGLVDYAMVLDDPLYQQVHRRQAPTYQHATQALTGVYATDPNYHLKLNQLISSYHLDRFDRQSADKPIKNQVSANREKPTPTAKPVTNQTVKPGTWKWSMLGGIGSAGLWVVVKRFW